jgi:hypothetical protein
MAPPDRAKAIITRLNRAQQNPQRCVSNPSPHVSAAQQTSDSCTIYLNYDSLFNAMSLTDFSAAHASTPVTPRLPIFTGRAKLGQTCHIIIRGDNRNTVYLSLDLYMQCDCERGRCRMQHKGCDQIFLRSSRLSVLGHLLPV